jgi:MoxR-like ATPase
MTMNDDRGTTSALVQNAGVFVRRYFTGKAPKVPVRRGATGDDPGFRRSGDELVQEILDSIRLKRSVLVSGPRGCGKSYCSEQAIRSAIREGTIGNYRFLQGNREIPREALSEDSIVLVDGGAMVLKALALRPFKDAGKLEPAERARLEELRKAHPDFPAIRCNEVEGRVEAERLWEPRDWCVLYLDEITRFGDGFLDSLLSLTEEGKIVRRGEDYYVPMVLVATANPPGYDPTAKKLSPPLQARIASSFPVLQPGLELLAREIAWRRVQSTYDQLGVALERRETSADSTIVRLASAASLCLWGNPDDRNVRGLAYLDQETMSLLRTVMSKDQVLADEMRALSSLLVFGPDARAVCDWLARAIARANAAERRTTLEDLEATAVAVLAHKVRENFNEGTEPEKKRELNRCVRAIVQRVFHQREVYEELLPNFEDVLTELARLGASKEKLCAAVVRSALGELKPVARRTPWRRALTQLPVMLEDEDEFVQWQLRARGMGALISDAQGRPRWHNEDELGTITRLLDAVGLTRHGAKMRGIPLNVATELAERMLLDERLAPFGPALTPIVEEKRGERVLADRRAIDAWLASLRAVVGPEPGVSSADLEKSYWSLVGFERQWRRWAPSEVAALLSESFERIEAVANTPGRRRAQRMIRLLEIGRDLGDALENTPQGAHAWEALLRLAFALIEAREAETSRRVASWCEFLEKTLPAAGLSKADVAKQACATGALDRAGLFVNGVERRWALGERRALGVLASMFEPGAEPELPAISPQRVARRAVSRAAGRDPEAVPGFDGHPEEDRSGGMSGVRALVVRVRHAMHRPLDRAALEKLARSVVKGMVEARVSGDGPNIPARELTESMEQAERSLALLVQPLIRASNLRVAVWDGLIRSSDRWSTDVTGRFVEARWWKAWRVGACVVDAVRSGDEQNARYFYVAKSVQLMREFAEAHAGVSAERRVESGVEASDRVLNWLAERPERMDKADVQLLRQLVDAARRAARA